MGDTVRKFAVKITSDTTELNTGFKKLKDAIDGVKTSLKNTFGGMDNDIKKATQAVNSEIDKLGKEVVDQSKKNMDVIVKNTQTQLKTVEKGSKQEQKVKTDSIKAVTAERKKAATEAKQIERQRVKDVERSAKDAAKAFKDAVNQFGEIDVVQINKTKAIEDVQDLGRVLKNKNKTIQEEIRRELKGLDSNRIEDINASEKRLLSVIDRANERQLKEIRDAGRERLRIVGKTSSKRVEIEREMQTQLLNARRQGQSRLASVRSTAGARRTQAPREQRVGRIGRGGAMFSEMGQAARSATPAMGGFGGALSKLGPVGIAVGLTLGGLGKLFGAAAKKSAEFEQGLAKIKTTIDPSQYDALAGSTDKLRQFSRETGIEINTLNDGLFNAASAVSAFKKDTDSGAEAVIRASKTAVGLSTDSSNLVSVMGDLGNSFELNLSSAENQQAIMDVMAQTFKDGKLSGDELSSTIVKGAKSISLLSENGLKGVSTLGQMTASMTASGINAAESSTAINKLGNELLDMKTATKLAEAGLSGISTEGGKVKVNFEELFQSVGGDAEKFAQMLGSDRAKLAFRVLASEGESSFTKMTEGFKDVSGASETAFDIMNSTSDASTKQLKATFDDALLTIGGPFDDALTSVTDGAKGALIAIADLFKGDQQIFRELTAEAEAATTQYENISKAVDQANSSVEVFNKQLEETGEVSKEGLEAALEKVRKQAEGFKNTLPSIANNINKIIDAEGDKTVGTLQAVTAELQRAEDISKRQALARSIEAGAVAFDALAEKIEETSGEDADEIFSANSDNILEQQRELEIIDIRRKLLQGEINDAQALELAGSEGRKKVLKDIASFRQGEEAIAIRLSQVDDDRLAIDIELSDQVTKRELVQQQILASTQSQIDGARSLATLKEREFDLEKTIEVIQAKARAKFGDTVALREDQARLMTQLLVQEAESLGHEKEALQLRIEGVDALIEAGGVFGVMQIDLQKQKETLQEQFNNFEAIKAETEEIARIEKETADIIAGANTQVSEGVALAREKLGLEEEFVALKFEESDVTDAVNMLIEDSLGTEEMSLDTEIEKMDVLLGEQEVRLDTLTIEGEELKNEELVLGLMAQQLALAGLSNDSVLENIALLQARRAEIENTTNALSASISSIGGKLDKLQKKQVVRQTFGIDTSKISGKAGGKDNARAEKKASREADRAKKDEERATQKAAREAEKEQKGIEKEELKRRKDALNENKKLDKADQDLKKKAMAEAEKREAERKKVIELQKKLDTQRFQNGIKRASSRRKAEKDRESAVKDATDRLRDLGNAQANNILSGIKSVTNRFRTVADLIRDMGNDIKKSTQNYVAQLRQQVEAQKVAALQAQSAKNTAKDTVLSALAGVGGVGAEKSEQIKQSIQTDARGKPLGFSDPEQLKTELKDLIEAAQKAGGVAGKTRETALDNILANFEKALDEQNEKTRGGFEIINKTLVLAGSTQFKSFEQFREVMFQISEGMRFGGENSLVKSLPSAFGLVGGKIDIKESESDKRAPLDTSQVETLGEFQEFGGTFKILGDQMEKSIETFKNIKDIGGIKDAQLALARYNEDLENSQNSLATQNKLFTEFLSSNEFLAVLNADLSKEQRQQLGSGVELLQQRAKIAKTELEFQSKNVGSLLKRLTIQEKLNALQGDTNAVLAEIDGFGKKELTNVEQTEQQFSKIFTTLAETISLTKEQIEIEKKLNVDLGERLKLREAELTRGEAFLELLKATSDGSAESKIRIDNQIKDNRVLQDEINGLTGEIDDNTKSIDDNTKSIGENKAAQKEAAKKSPAEIKEAERKDTKKDIAEAGGDSIKLFKEAGKAFDKGFSDEALGAVADGIAGIAGQAKQISDLSFESFDTIAGIANAQDVAGGLEAGGELAQKIGAALMESKSPEIKLAGAIILGVGLIAQAVGKIMNILKGVEEDTEGIQRRKLMVLEAQTAELEAQIALTNELADRGEAEVDTAHERLDILKEGTAELIKANGELGKLSTEFAGDGVLDLDFGGLSQAAIDTQVWIDSLELAKDLLESATGLTGRGANEAQEDAVKEARKLTGFTLDFGKTVQDSDLEKFVNSINGRLADASTRLTGIRTLITMDEEGFALFKQLVVEDLSQIDAEISVGLDVDDLDSVFFNLGQKVSTLREQVFGAVDLSGLEGVDLPIDFGTATAEEIKRALPDLADLFSGGIIPPELMASINELLDGLTEVEDTSAAILDKNIELIRAREGIGEVTEEQADEDVLKLLEDQLALLEEQWDFNNLTIDQEMVIIGLKQQILDITNEQNSADEEGNDKLVEAVRQRQKLLELLRIQSEGGTLTPDQQANLKASGDQIVNELRAAGKSEAEIKEFMMTLPQFAEGGKVQKTGLSMLSEGEHVLTAQKAKSMDEQLSLMASILSKNGMGGQLFTKSDGLIQAATTQILKKEAQNIQNSSQNNSTVGSIIININGTGGNPKEIAQEVGNEVKKVIINTVQGGFDRREIDIRGQSI